MIFIFPWNKKRKIDLFKFLIQLGELLLLSGFDYKAFEKNKPRDGQIDEYYKEISK